MRQILKTTNAAIAKTASQATRVSRPRKASSTSPSASRPTIQIRKVSAPNAAETAYSTSATWVISFAFGSTGRTWVASSTASTGRTVDSRPTKAKKVLPARPLNVL
ncbi:hypothetical protein B0E53_03609 [Micromonospora sp. MH33]|nr:hypothetical protein B0E53_03609 [Micromonospora sp. MH33]